jgi:YegS/Rv2252/BmrU family lipid kinase
MTVNGRACVIFNPSSGKGRAKRLLDAVRSLVNGKVDFLPIPAAGAGEHTARSALDAGYRTLIAAGGDGTVHDVANALLSAGLKDTMLGVWPLGSANDFAFSLKIDKPWERLEQLATRPVDVGLIETLCGRRRWFVNSLGVGFNGAVTLEARKIKWLRGMLLYGLGIIQAMRKHYRHPMLRVSADGNVRETASLSLTVNLGKREGGFPLTPNAEVDDGLFDLLHVGAISRWELTKHLPKMATGKIPDDHPLVWKSRAREVTIESPEPMRIHLDGEFFCHPEDGITKATVRLLPGALRVQC